MTRCRRIAPGGTHEAAVGHRRPGNRSFFQERHGAGGAVGIPGGGGALFHHLPAGLQRHVSGGPAEPPQRQLHESGRRAVPAHGQQYHLFPDVFDARDHHAAVRARIRVRTLRVDRQLAGAGPHLGTGKMDVRLADRRGDDPGRIRLFRGGLVFGLARSGAGRRRGDRRTPFRGLSGGLGRVGLQSVQSPDGRLFSGLYLVHVPVHRRRPGKVSAGTAGNRHP